MASSCPIATHSPLEGWLSVNNSPRYCRLTNGVLDVASDENLEKIEYSIPLSKIVETVPVNTTELDVLPENSPTLHFTSDDKNEIKKWTMAISDNEVTQKPLMNLNEFSILRTIGKGYCGRVHLAKRTIDNKLYALKSINKIRLINSAMVQRTITERNILLQANHQLFPKLYAAFQTEEQLILVLEYVGGGDLQHHLDKGLTFSHKQIKLYLAELVIALAHIHKMGIVFRDLKPSNILITKDGNLKLTDFGLAKDLIESGNTKSLCGTHEYLAPEMINGEAYGFEVDWWALGVLAFRLTCGFLPFHSDNLCRLYEMIVACKYRMPKNIDLSTKDLINGLLQVKPENRLNLEKIYSHKYFSDVNWQKLYKKEYKMDFVPWMSDDENAPNFDVIKETHDADGCSDENESGCSSASCSPPAERMHIQNFSFSALDNIEKVPEFNAHQFQKTASLLASEKII